MFPSHATQVARIRWKLFAALLFAPIVLTTGCANNTETGALAGAGIGGLGGAIVGSAVRAPVAGAAIGAAVGGLTGAAIGNDKDRQEARAAAIAQARALGITDIAQMAQQNVPDNIIINQIRTSPTIFHLSATDITWLRENRVSDAVIQEMQLTAMRVPRRVYVDGAVYPPPPVVVVDPPPVAFGFDYGYRRRW